MEGYSLVGYSDGRVLHTRDHGNLLGRLGNPPQRRCEEDAGGGDGDGTSTIEESHLARLFDDVHCCSLYGDRQTQVVAVSRDERVGRRSGGGTCSRDGRLECLFEDFEACCDGLHGDGVSTEVE